MHAQRNRRVIVTKVIIEAVRIVVMDDSSDEDKPVLEKVDNFAELTVPNMTDRQFQMHFRITHASFEDLLNKLNIALHNEGPRQAGFPRTQLEKELLITIWCLSNTESFRSIADRFGISKSTCWSVLYRTCHLLLQANRRFRIIAWPSRAQQDEIRQNFVRTTHGFPGIIGCIDGSHIEIPAPREHHVSYINRKGYHSVLLQGVCDHKKRFLHVYAGEAGSIHDYTLFRRSDLSLGIQNGDLTFYDDAHLIGDLAYKLDINLLVGFKNNGRLTNRQKNFNFTLNKGRVTIENAFALLKGRFRRLKVLDTVRLDLSALLIVSGCVLHNICLENNDLLENVIDLDDERRQENGRNPRNFRDIIPPEERNQAIIKRNNIVNALPMQIRVQR